MIRTLRFIAFMLIATAVAAPFAQAKSDPGFVQSYLQQLGLTRTQATSWTTGVCSYAVKPGSCELSQAQARAASLGLSRAMLATSGMTREQIESWTHGVCSDRVKPSSCWLTPAEARLASLRLAQSMGAPSPPAVAAVQVSGRGFDWGDALIGAAVTAGVFLIGSAGVLGIRRRRELVHG